MSNDARPWPAASPVAAALRTCRPHFVAAAAFSAVASLLYLTPTLYMLQVYGRVIPTGGLATLLLLSLVALAGLALLGLLEWLRSRLLVRASARFDVALAGRAVATVLAQPGLSRADRAQAMRHFDTLRQAMASPGVVAALDAPWTPVYVIASFLLHPLLGLLTVAGGIVLLGLAWHNDRATHAVLRDASDAAAVAHMQQAQATAHAAEVRALGMRQALTARQLRDRAVVNDLQARASFAAGNHNGLIKFLRLALQSASMGVGALLIVEGSIAAGAMIAASLLMARALAPIEQIVGAWKTMVQAREAHRALDALFANEDGRTPTRLPAPGGRIEVEALTVLTPEQDRVAVDGISFAVKPGELIGVIGMSGAGKSTLLRALAGAASPARGHIRFDGASSADWDAEALARHIGYLPQDFVLFPGSVKENIARFAGELGGDAAALDAAVVRAAQAIGAHDMIVRLPKGYDTPIGPGGAGLSAGQTQRVAFARALFGGPRILILDEPNAHLDSEAGFALMQTLNRLRQDGVTIILAAHSNDLLAAADKLLLLDAGRIVRFEPLSAMRPKPIARPVGYTPAEEARA